MLLDLILRFCLRHRGAVLALGLIAVLQGVLAVKNSRLDIYPEFSPVLVTVQTEAPGFSPEEVEKLVSTPVERALGGAIGLKTLKSESIPGLSVVNALFDDKIDMAKARQTVTETLQGLARDLPVGVETPAVQPFTTSTSMVLSIGLLSDKLSQLELRRFADEILAPRLQAVRGVASVTCFGGQATQIQIKADPARLQALGIGLDSLADALRSACAPGGAGFIENDRQRLLVHSAPLRRKEDLAKISLELPGGGRILLGQVADINEGPEASKGDASIGGKPGVIVVMTNQFGSNTVEVTDACEHELAEMASTFKVRNIDYVPGLFRPADFVKAASKNMQHALLSGAILVTVILLLFLFNLRAAVISLAAIPLSLLAAVTILHWRGLSLDTLSLAGLAIALGEVVDDAIIDVENICRRLRENSRLSLPLPRLQVIFGASREVRSTVIFATLAVVIAFVPLLLLEGVIGRLFSPLAYAYILAVLASLGVAVTITPALAALLLREKAGGAHEPPLVAVLQKLYRRLLTPLLGAPKIILGACLVLVIGAGVLLTQVGGGFLPAFRESHFIVHMTASPGTSVAESLRIGGNLSREIMKIPGVIVASQRVGRARKGEDTLASHNSEIDVALEPDAEPAQIQELIETATAAYPGVSCAVKPFLNERMDELAEGTTSDFALHLYGQDMETLNRTTAAAFDILQGVKGRSELESEAAPNASGLDIRFDEAALAAAGFSRADALLSLRAAMEGEVCGQMNPGALPEEVVLRLDHATAEPLSLGAILIGRAGKPLVRLDQVAHLQLVSGAVGISHENGLRCRVISCNIRPEIDPSDFAARAKEAIRTRLNVPPGIDLSYSGQDEARSRSFLALAGGAVAAILGMLVLLSFAVKRFSHLALILASLPFALVGGVVAVTISGGDLNVGAAVGFVTLLGLSTRNALMMIGHFDRLVSEGLPWNAETAIRAASERLAPVLMTALVTALALLPIALGGDSAGREIEAPMAAVILGGLTSSTLLNLLVLPVLALRFAKFDRREEEI